MIFGEEGVEPHSSVPEGKEGWKREREREREGERERERERGRERGRERERGKGRERERERERERDGANKQRDKQLCVLTGLVIAIGSVGDIAMAINGQVHVGGLQVELQYAVVTELVGNGGPAKGCHQWGGVQVLLDLLRVCVCVCVCVCVRACVFLSKSCNVSSNLWLNDD